MASLITLISESRKRWTVGNSGAGSGSSAFKFLKAGSLAVSQTSVQVRHVTHLDTQELLALKALATGLRSRDGDHWTLEKVGETLGVDPSTVMRWVPESTFAFAKVDERARMVGKDGKSRPHEIHPTEHDAT